MRRIYNIAGSFGGSGAGFLQGPPKVWAEQLAGLALDEGISGFVLMADDAATMERFAAEVAPSVRELVASDARQRAALRRSGLGQCQRLREAAPAEDPAGASMRPGAGGVGRWLPWRRG